MKEELWELFVDFNWGKALLAMLTCVAIALFIVGTTFAIETANAWWLLLWIVSAICISIIAGLRKADF